MKPWAEQFYNSEAWHACRDAFLLSLIHILDNLKRLTEQCALSLDLREREKALARAAEPEQFSLNVDPATGEIVEGESEVADNA